MQQNQDVHHPSLTIFSINPCLGISSDQNTCTSILVPKNSKCEQIRMKTIKQNLMIQSALSQFNLLSWTDGSESLYGRIQCWAKSELEIQTAMQQNQDLLTHPFWMFSINPCPGIISDQNTCTSILVPKNSKCEQIRVKTLKQNSIIQSALTQ